jgi:hypothetical protein
MLDKPRNPLTAAAFCIDGALGMDEVEVVEKTVIPEVAGLDPIELFQIRSENSLELDSWIRAGLNRKPNSKSSMISPLEISSTISAPSLDKSLSTPPLMAGCERMFPIVSIPGRWGSKLALNVDEAASGNEETVVSLASAPGEAEKSRKGSYSAFLPLLVSEPILLGR